MHRMFAVLAAVAMMFLGAGVADASPGTYKVSKTWQLRYVGPDRTPTIIPRIEDDVVEVTCRNHDRMKSWKINNPALNGGTWKRIDRTGIQLQPEWTGKNETLRLTVTCRRS
jgi:hypothetical protein